MSIDQFQPLNLTTEETLLLKNGELGKLLGPLPMPGDPQDLFNAQSDWIGVEEREEESLCFTEENWLDRDSVFKILMPVYNLILDKDIPLPLRQALPSYLYSWVYAIWWREKIAKTFFSKQKEIVGDTFNLINSENLLDRKKIYTELKLHHAEIIPDWVLPELIKEERDRGRLYVWANRLENLTQFRLTEREFKIFKHFPSERAVLARTLLKPLEKDLVTWKIFNSKKTKTLPEDGGNQNVLRCTQSFDRFRQHDPEKSLPKLTKRIYAKSPGLMEQWKKTFSAVSYKDIKSNKIGRPKKIKN